MKASADLVDTDFAAELSRRWAAERIVCGVDTKPARSRSRDGRSRMRSPLRKR
jgi:hypothetical protein